MAYVAVELPNGDSGIGSAFHVGDGVFITARHVVEGNQVVEVGSTEITYVTLEGEEAEGARTFLQVDGESQPVHRVSNGVMQLSSGPYLSRSTDADIAVFSVVEIDPRTPLVELGSHLDDWLGESDFTLSEAVILGYPPIPFAKRPTLVGARAEVNAMIDLRSAPHVHFVLSAMPRGGFSGGVVVSEYGYALGMVTQSLLSDGSPAELGYMAAVSIEPIYQCLADHRMLPGVQAEPWDGLWNSYHLSFTTPTESPLFGVVEQQVAEVVVFDDGRELSLTVTCGTENSELLHSSITIARSMLSDLPVTEEEIRRGEFRLELATDYTATAVEAIYAAARAVASNLLRGGLTMSGYQPAVEPRMRPDDTRIDLVDGKST